MSDFVEITQFHIEKETEKAILISANLQEFEGEKTFWLTKSKCVIEDKIIKVEAEIFNSKVEELKNPPAERKIVLETKTYDKAEKATKLTIVVKVDNKEEDLTGSMASQGTTPRRLTDLIGSLADLTSGSGDKGTPIVYIKGYFDNFTK